MIDALGRFIDRWIIVSPRVNVGPAARGAEVKRGIGWRFGADRVAGHVWGFLLGASSRLARAKRVGEARGAGHRGRSEPREAQDRKEAQKRG